MSDMELTSPSLGEQIPALIGSAAVVALVPATKDHAWASEIAWRIARACAAKGRRTALVDCFVNDPQLHSATGATNDEGIVDAFEYGASLQRIVQAQPEAHLFFIPAGTYASDPAPLMTHPRWRRLSAGFRHEDALLLLFCDAAALSGMAAEPEGMIVLAPQGVDLAIAEWPALADAVGRGAPPLLAVVAEEEKPRPIAAAHEVKIATSLDELPAPPPVPKPRPSAAARRASVPMGMIIEKKRAPWGMIAAVLVIVGGAVAGLLFRDQLLRLAGFLPPADSVAAPAAADSSATVPAPPKTPPAESLPFAVQVSAWQSLADAFNVADTLELRGQRTMITPIRLQGRTWYRVYAGPLASRAQADSVLAQLRARGALGAAAGSVHAVPLSFALPGTYAAGQADAERMRLRRLGVPAFVLGLADGSYGLFAGAFDAAAPAATLERLLTPTGGAGSLAPRVGFLP